MNGDGYPERVEVTVVGVIFWISAWQLTSLLTEHLSKKKRLAIYTALVVISILILAALYRRRKSREAHSPVISESASPDTETSSI